ncbi:hypothetical protein J2M53_15450 [Arthrobacter sp. zg-ZUI100]|uniref:hypothetical protein n=1 Tax=Arthrobacter jiangjiafuii TaxID=2817475 RepID=UPI001AEE5F0E|nr:hypothetical protein [Arthrobacter jiangjiafuii]MBP3037641.1 hypothetical protein [Arthrobacter jiangjiafuii]
MELRKMPHLTARRSTAVLTLALSSLLAFSACASPAEEEPKTESTAAAEEAPTPEAVWPEGDEKGTLANPYSIGEEMVDGDWSLTIDSVNLDANAEIAAMDSIIAKVAPDAGNTWVTLTATWKYNGTEPAEGGTSFAVVNENWKDVFDSENKYLTTFNDISTLKPDESKAGPAEPGSSVTADAILQMPVEHANTSSMIVAQFGQENSHDFLVALD